MKAVREVGLFGSLFGLIVCASNGWAWPTIGALAVLTVLLLVATESRAR